MLIIDAAQAWGTEGSYHLRHKHKDATLRFLPFTVMAYASKKIAT